MKDPRKSPPPTCHLVCLMLPVARTTAMFTQGTSALGQLSLAGRYLQGSQEQLGMFSGVTWCQTQIVPSATSPAVSEKSSNMHCQHLNQNQRQGWLVPMWNQDLSRERISTPETLSGYFENPEFLCGSDTRADKRQTWG